MEKLKICYVCGGAPNIRAIKDRNFIGQEMYKATAMCTFCGKKVEVYGATATAAVELVQEYWNYGCHD